MTIEILFGEIANLYGDSGNVLYIEKTFKKANIIKTSILDEPYFVTHKVDFIYLGPMSEKSMLRVLEKLKPYKAKLETMIKENVLFLFTGNALDILGKKIILDSNKEIEGLGIFNSQAKIDESNRYNSLFLGSYNQIKEKIVGYKSQSSNSIIEENPLFNVILENNHAKVEGININNFFGTNLLGPILILNPYFTKYLFSLLGYKDKLYLEDDLILAYQKRLKEYENPKIKY